METASHRLPPLVAAALVSIILFCAAGIAAFISLLPGRGQQAQAEAGLPSPPAAAARLASEDPPPLTPVRDPAPKEPEPPQHIAQQATAVPQPAPAAHHPQQLAANTVPAPAMPACAECGTVEAVNTAVIESRPSGIGAVGGAVLGGVVGHQFGNGRGQDAMTAAGAIGGALAGHAIEKQRRRVTRYDVVVRMEDGSQRTVSFPNAPGFARGDHVRLQDGGLRHAD